jgi:hypothetical protein
MRRRAVLLGAATPLALAGCGTSAPAAPFDSLGSALRLLHELPATARTAEGWPLAQVLVHAAQSVEYSMAGFPQPNSALFRATVGPLAFAVFDARGRMSHGLTEPIPGAPAIDATTPLAAARDRLVKALTDFDAHTGPLQPHFAYGDLDKGSFLRAHLMHLADHWQHVRVA